MILLGPAHATVDRSYQSMLSAVSRVPGMSIMLYDKTAWPSVG